MPGKLLLYVVMLLLLATSCNRPKRHLVISRIQSTAKLATTETIIDKIIIGTKSRKLLGIVQINQAEFVAYTQATVKTGVDLTKLKAKDVNIRGNLIEVQLPMVQVLDFAYPFDKFRIDTVLSDNAFLNRIDVIDQENYFRGAELDIRKNIRYMGIKEQTEENTRKMMESLLRNLGFEEIYITFSDSGIFIPQVNINPE
jgi:hypothetical protein